MATKRKCPNCETQTEQQKKGKSTTGAQRWKCNECGKQHTEGVPTKTPKKKAAPKKPATKKVSSSKQTTIKVNNNVVKTVKGELSPDEAFELASDYFREITKTSVKSTKDSNGNVIHAFQVSTGRKG